MEFIYFGWAAMFALAVIAIVISVNQKRIENDFVDSARTIRKGMTKSEVVAILGTDYSYSCLKNGVEKLTLDKRFNP